MIPHIDCSLCEARAHTDGDSLIVTTGAVRRVWQWMDAGFATAAVTHVLERRPSTLRYLNFD